MQRHVLISLVASIVVGCAVEPFQPKEDASVNPDTATIPDTLEDAPQWPETIPDGDLAIDTIADTEPPADSLPDTSQPSDTIVDAELETADADVETEADGPPDSSIETADPEVPFCRWDQSNWDGCLWAP